MATLNRQILNDALANGEFSLLLGNRSRAHLRCSVITAIEVIKTIEAHKDTGLTCGEITEKMGLRYPTVNQFLAWLRDKGLVRAEVQPDKQGKPILYFPCK